jgi:hypothetical protein
LILIIAFIISSGIFAQGTDTVPTQERMDQVLNDAMTTEKPAVQVKKPAAKKIKPVKKIKTEKVTKAKVTEAKVTEGGKVNE